jgi:SAM-dependent methyltransferase
MQSGNAESLLKYLARYFNRQGPKPDSWLDIGCGPGLVAFVAEERIRIHQCAWLNRCRKRIGFDYAPSLLEQMPPWIKPRYTDLFVGDVLKVDPKRLLYKTGVSQVDLLLANNVFHWLFTEEAIDAAFKRCRDILKSGGCLAVSIAAIGSARDFLQAYECEVREALNPKDYERWRSHLQNPIGLQSLDGIVRIARRNGFIIEPADAQLVYEPVRYNNGTDEYVEDARSYGDHVFMAPLFNQSRQQKDEVWQGIMRRLRQSYQSQFNGSVYVHDQYMIYLLARRDD